MRTVSTALATALGAPVQQPAILVEIAFSSTVRWSSFSTITWNSQTWTREAVTLESLQVEALRLTGSLVIANGDDVAAALVLNEGVADRSIRLWGYDAAATATGDVVWLADAIGGACSVDTDAVRIELRHPAELMVTPRTFVDPATFGPLLPAGSVIKINGTDYRLERRG